LDYLPDDFPKRQEFIDAEIDIINALIKYQDEATGLWYQVVDRGDDPNNWHETSCTSLYTYSIAKAIKKGLISADKYAKYAHKGYQGVIDTLAFEGEDVIVSKICVGTGVGNYEFYLKRPTVANDLHGMGAFVLMCSEYYDAFGPART
jgi:unsaturated rhamnogalacturonyl hydrolase